MEYLDATDITLDDADTNTNGHQVDLAVGETAFKVKVTSGAETETYTVTVERNSAYLFGWTPTRDINALEAAGNADPQGMWSDGTTMWVADDEDNKLYAYTLATGAYDSGKDITLHTGNVDPRGIWANGTTIWVADAGDDMLYAYTRSSKARDTSKEFSLHANNVDPAGIWSDETTIWVANAGDAIDSPNKVFAYTLSGGASDTDKEFVVSRIPGGIWGHGTTMWVVSDIGVNVGTLVAAYTITGDNHGRVESDKGFALRAPDGTSPVGIWSDGKGAVWITAPDSPKVESYNMLPFSAGSTTLSALAINDGTSDATLRPTFALTTLTYRTSVTDDVNRVTVSATPSESTATVAYLDANGEALVDADSSTGFQVDVAVGTTPIQILVTGQDGAALIHSVFVERDSGLPGGWTPTKDLYDLDPLANQYPKGIWSNGTTMWVTNTGEHGSIDSLRLHAGHQRTRRGQGHHSAHRQRQPAGHLVQRYHHLGLRLGGQETLRLHAGLQRTRRGQGHRSSHRQQYCRRHMVKWDDRVGVRRECQEAICLCPGRRWTRRGQRRRPDSKRPS